MPAELMAGGQPWRHANEGLVPVLAWLSLEKWQSQWTVRLSSDAQLAGLTENNLEDWHEGRGLTEVAGADDVSVDAQPFRVVPGLDAPCNAVETVDDCWGKRLLPEPVVQELQAFAGVI